MGCDGRASGVGQVLHTQTTLLLYVSVPRAASFCTGAWSLLQATRTVPPTSILLDTLADSPEIDDRNHVGKEAITVTVFYHLSRLQRLEMSVAAENRGGSLYQETKNHPNDV